MFSLAVVISSLALCSLAQFEPHNHNKFKVFDSENVMTGFLKVGQEAKIFYWFFESRSYPVNDPIIVHTPGNYPGQAVESAIFRETGPYLFDNHDGLQFNPYSWNSMANVLYLDVPLGSGYSKYTDWQDIALFSSQVADHIMQALDEFFKWHPVFKNNKIILSGDDYSAKYQAYVSDKMMDRPDYNLGGAILAAPWVDPLYQYPAYAEYANQQNLLNFGHYAMLKILFKACESSLFLDVPFAANWICGLAKHSITGFPAYPIFNPYDYRLPAADWFHWYPATENLGDLLNSEAFFDYFTDVPKSDAWFPFNEYVLYPLILDIQKNTGVYFSKMIDHGVPLLVYVGQYDFENNYMGQDSWMKALQWHGAVAWQEAEIKPWVLHSGSDIASVKNFENLTLMIMNDVGHYTVRERPKELQIAISQFINTGKLNTDPL